MHLLRLQPALTLVLAGVALGAASGCGSDDGGQAKAPIGSPERPLVAHPAGEGATATAPGAAASGTSREPGSVASSSSVAKAKAKPGTAREGADASTAVEPGAATPKPNYAQLLANQTSHPNKRFSPCNLVTAREAAQIIGHPVQQPVEAPQGPTCVYRPRSGKASLVAVAVQSTRFAAIKAHLEAMRTAEVGGRTAYCGRYGQPMLYVPLSGGRLLSVTGTCSTAKSFAAKALKHL